MTLTLSRGCCVRSLPVIGRAYAHLMQHLLHLAPRSPAGELKAVARPSIRACKTQSYPTPSSRGRPRRMQASASTTGSSCASRPTAMTTGRSIATSSEHFSTACATLSSRHAAGALRGRPWTLPLDGARPGGSCWPACSTRWSQHADAAGPARGTGRRVPPVHMRGRLRPERSDLACRAREAVGRDTAAGWACARAVCALGCALTGRNPVSAASPSASSRSSSSLLGLDPNGRQLEFRSSGARQQLMLGGSEKELKY
jgi:hypothetical protein